MVEAKLKWTGGFRFEGVSLFGHPIATDAAKTAGGTENGYKPSELVLFGLAGCTGIDVAQILKKMRQELTGIEIEVKGYQPEEFPKPFNKIEVRYIFRGKNLDKSKIEQAINLSEEKYCMVSQTLKGMAHINSTYEIHEE
ncbi:MAG: OsmC family protein [candidate division Zixibacteria bacterium]|nr:OsmC family protein [candidate division Zixibacteria bacterium]